MDIRVKEPMYVTVGESQYCVRALTFGVIKGQVVYFKDATSTVSVGIPKETCLSTPSIFQVNRSMTDLDVSRNAVIKALIKQGIEQEMIHKVLEDL